MDWKACAVDDLRRYRHMKIGVLNSRDKLRMLSSQATSARTTANRQREKTSTKLIDTIVETERLKTNLDVAENLVGLIERGLDSLSEEERTILERFYISDLPKNMTRLKGELGYEERSLYRLRDRALRKFTLAMYGVEMM